MKRKHVLLLILGAVGLVFALSFVLFMKMGETEVADEGTNYNNYIFITPSGKTLYPEDWVGDDDTGHRTIDFDYNGVSLDVKNFKNGVFNAKKYTGYKVKQFSGKTVQQTKFTTDYRGNPAIQFADKSTLPAALFKNKYYNVKAHYQKYRYTMLNGKSYRPIKVVYTRHGVARMWFKFSKRWYLPMLFKNYKFDERQMQNVTLKAFDGTNLQPNKITDIKVVTDDNYTSQIIMAKVQFNGVKSKFIYMTDYRDDGMTYSDLDEEPDFTPKSRMVDLHQFAKYKYIDRHGIKHAATNANVYGYVYFGKKHFPLYYFDEHDVFNLHVKLTLMNGKVMYPTKMYYDDEASNGRDDPMMYKFPDGSQWAVPLFKNNALNLNKYAKSVLTNPDGKKYKALDVSWDLQSYGGKDMTDSSDTWTIPSLSIKYANKEWYNLHFLDKHNNINLQKYGKYVLIMPNGEKYVPSRVTMSWYPKVKHAVGPFGASIRLHYDRQFKRLSFKPKEYTDKRMDLRTAVYLRQNGHYADVLGSRPNKWGHYVFITRKDRVTGKDFNKYTENDGTTIVAASTREKDQRYTKYGNYVFVKNGQKYKPIKIDQARKKLTFRVDQQAVTLAINKFKHGQYHQ